MYVYSQQLLEKGGTETIFEKVTFISYKGHFSSQNQS